MLEVQLLQMVRVSEHNLPQRRLRTVDSEQNPDLPRSHRQAKLPDLPRAHDLRRHLGANPVLAEQRLELAEVGDSFAV